MTQNGRDWLIAKDVGCFQRWKRNCHWECKLLRRNKMGRWYSAIVLTGWLLLGLGCMAPSIPETVSTGGSVLFQGKPLAGAYVTFIGEEGQSAVGQTDAQGQFKLTSHFGPKAEAQGVVARHYKVIISKMVPPGTMTEDEYKRISDAANAIVAGGGVVPQDKQPPPKVELLPAKYSDAANTELSADASDEINDFTFDLK